MPNPIYTGGGGATTTLQAETQAAIDKAAAEGYYGVRLDGGVANYGSPTALSSTHVNVVALKNIVGHALDKGLHVIVLLGYGPRISQELADDFNGGVLWKERNRPPQGTTAATVNGVTYNNLWDWIGRGLWQTLVDAVNAAVTSRSLSMGTWVTFEWCNEPCKGGVGGPFIGGSLSQATYEPPYDAYPFGTIEPAFWTYINTVRQLVNSYGAKTIGYNLEGQAGSEGDVEVNSCTGADCAAITAACDYVGFNCYARAGATGTAIIQDWGLTKMPSNIARMQANPTIGAKPLVNNEFGAKKEIALACSTANYLRQRILKDYAMTIAGVQWCGFYAIFDPANDFNAYNYNAATQTATPVLTQSGTPDIDVGPVNP